MSRVVQVKTLKGETFSIDVAEEALISDVKAKISEVRGVDPSTQVLICAGKTLQDAATLAASLGTNGFLVLMVKTKRRAAPASIATSHPAAAAATPTTSSGASAASTAPTPPTAAVPSAAPQTAPAPPTPSQAAAVAAPAAAAAPVAAAAPAAAAAVDPAGVEQLVAMGFPEDQARAALQAAFNDVSRAAGYLMEGIPDQGMDRGVAAEGGQGVGTMEDLLGAQAMAMGEEDDDGNEGEGGLMGMMGEGNPLNFMRFHPQFDQLRDLVRESPAMLPQMLQQLGNESPELMEQINAHPDDFLRLMNEPPDAQGQAMMDMGLQGMMDAEEHDDDDDGGVEGLPAMGDAGTGAGGAGGRGQITVELTVEEEAQVSNLMAMVPGVGRDQVIEAFIACDKNVEMAANLLFENM